MKDCRNLSFLIKSHEYPALTPLNMVQIAAQIFILITAVVCAFQLALIFGAPWGEFTLGGRWRGRLPLVGKVLAGASLVLLMGLAVVIGSRAGLAFAGLQRFAPALAWVVVGYCAVGVLANAATRSRRERLIWLPVITSMLISSTVVATS